MIPNLRQALEYLQEAAAVLIRAKEYGEATIPPLNREIVRLFQLGLLPELVYPGRILLSEPYREENDSGIAYAAVLSTARGFGAVMLDTEDPWPPSSAKSELTTHMLPYEQLPARVQAHLAIHASRLVAPLLYDLHLVSYVPTAELSQEPPPISSCVL